MSEAAPTIPYSAEPEITGVRRFTRAFRSRNYRLFFCGQGLSLVGTWLTNVATAWLVYRLTKDEGAARSAAWLGIVVFASQIPLFVMSPFTGVLADRSDRRRIMVITQTLSMLQSAAMAWLTISGVIQIWQVIVLAVFQGVVNAFDIPARQAFVVEMVDDRRDLPNAIALNSTMFNSARLVGPAVAGVMIASIGEGTCFAIDAVSYLAVIMGLLAMRIAPRVIDRVAKPIWHELKEGFHYSFGFPPTRALLIQVGILSFMGSSLSTLMPIFADLLIGPVRGAKVLGFISSGLGVGALCGGIYLASRKSVVGLGTVMVFTTITYGVALLGFSMVRHLYFALPILAICGFAFMVTLASANTMLQSIVDDDKRGRLMSFFSMMVMGMSPLGALLAGYLAGKTSVWITVQLAGVACVIAGIQFWVRLQKLRPLVRPIYVRKGIIPEISEAMERVEVPGAEEK